MSCRVSSERAKLILWIVQAVNILFQLLNIKFKKKLNNSKNFNTLQYLLYIMLFCLPWPMSIHVKCHAVLLLDVQIDIADRAVCEHFF